MPLFGRITCNESTIEISYFVESKRDLKLEFNAFQVFSIRCILCATLLNPMFAIAMNNADVSQDPLYNRPAPSV